jgi:murein DD-endopeptidase MepM/ murein hydrolase activator NlpD
MRRFLLFFVSLLIVVALIAGYFLFLSPTRGSLRSAFVVPWIRNASAHPNWGIKALERCGNAPFIFPTNGLVGYVWDDSFRPGQRHQGIDIFGGTEAGVTPVYAAYDGYLSRQAGWKSTVIIRIPADPLNPSQQIWTYYTHMADENGSSYISTGFPPGSSEVFVKAGTLLGYQGNFSGTSGNPVGVHLHFSIVRDDGFGNYLNELDIANTLDPSPYLGLTLNNNDQPKMPIKCGYPPEK